MSNTQSDQKMDLRPEDEIDETTMSSGKNGLPRQVELFSAIDTDDETNSIHLYDILPKYEHDGRERRITDSAFVQREVVIGKRKYQCEIQAARIKRGDGSEVMMFPSDREECVEDCLRKLAVTQAVFIDGEVGVSFSLYQLRKVLAKHGHTMSHHQIVEALQVLRRSGLRVTDESGAEWEESFFARLAKGGRRKEHLASDGYECWYVVFHKLVTKSIIDLTFRRMDFPTLMTIHGMLARYIYKRMVSVYTYASMEQPYEPTLTQMLTHSGRGFGTSFKNDIKAMNRALDQLKKAGVLLAWEERERKKDGRSTVDIRYRLWPTQRLTKQVIASNRASKKMKLEEVKDQLKDAK